MMAELTDRQGQVLSFIECNTTPKGPPSYRAIGAALGIASTNAVSDHLIALRRKGYLREDNTPLSREAWPSSAGRGSRACARRLPPTPEIIASRRERARMADIRRHIIGRCYRGTDVHFKDYGARGIRVCDRWLGSLDAFVADMGPRPTPGHSVERKDNNGPYSPDNCTWATHIDQCQNTRATIRVVIEGREMSLAAAIRMVGKASYSTVYGRIARGQSPEDALGLVQGKPPSPEQEATVLARWGAK